ncbi:unnamed protein product, partial [marine sediment metagenome]
EPILEQTQENVGKDKRIKAASADSGYYSESNVEYAQDNEIDVYIATGKIKHNAPVAKVPRGRIPKNLTVKKKRHHFRKGSCRGTTKESLTS